YGGGPTGQVCHVPVDRADRIKPAHEAGAVPIRSPARRRQVVDPVFGFRREVAAFPLAPVLSINSA
ncbi:MAG TPA: hypothetical protein VGC09_14320, partial [Rhodopila sp.]